MQIWTLSSDKEATVRPRIIPLSLIPAQKQGLTQGKAMRLLFLLHLSKLLVWNRPRHLPAVSSLFTSNFWLDSWRFKIANQKLLSFFLQHRNYNYYAAENGEYYWEEWLERTLILKVEVTKKWPPGNALWCIAIHWRNLLGQWPGVEKSSLRKVVGKTDFPQLGVPWKRVEKFDMEIKFILFSMVSARKEGRNNEIVLEFVQLRIIFYPFIFYPSPISHFLRASVARLKARWFT